jgi:hypothetical protein
MKREQQLRFAFGFIPGRIDFAAFEEYCTMRRRIEAERRYIETLAQIATTPIKLPARRRRSDREVPKAA